MRSGEKKSKAKLTPRPWEESKEARTKGKESVEKFLQQWFLVLIVFLSNRRTTYL